MKDRKLEVKWRDNSPIPDQRIQELDLDYGIDVTIQIRKNATTKYGITIFALLHSLSPSAIISLNRIKQVCSSGQGEIPDRRLQSASLRADLVRYQDRQ